jgi:purine nucleosidase
MKFSVLLVLVSWTLCATAWAGSPRTPVILDTDIGTDIDDAYALGVLLHRSDLQLLGVTTVSSDTSARARLAAKLLSVAGAQFAKVPVYGGVSTTTQYMKQVEWANGFESRSLHSAGAVEFIRGEIKRHPGKITLIAIGELTNIAAVLDSEPGIGKQIRAISLMGGSVYRGYQPGSAPEPEWNIKSNVAAARTVFASGVPLYIAPLDSTADLQLDVARREQIFAAGSPFNDALAALEFVWVNSKPWNAAAPTLFDVLAVEMAADKSPCPLTALHLDVTEEGITRSLADQPPNASVALKCNSSTLLDLVVERLKNR